MAASSGAARGALEDGRLREVAGGVPHPHGDTVTSQGHMERAQKTAACPSW